jgi:hypothetical protein
MSHETPSAFRAAVEFRLLERSFTTGFSINRFRRRNADAASLPSVFSYEEL